MERVKNIFKNKKVISFLGTIVIFLILLGMFYAVSQCISGNINISIGIN